MNSSFLSAYFYLFGFLVWGSSQGVTQSILRNNQPTSEVVASNAKPGNLIFENIGLEEGFPDPYTSATFQDNQGFIWFSNKKGLMRYDGLHYKIFQHNSEDSNSISNSFVWRVIQDHQGIIWVPTNGGGLNRFDPATETFSIFPLTSAEENMAASDLIWSVMEDSQRRLWVGTKGAGLFIIHSDRDSVTQFVHEPDDRKSLSGNFIAQCYEDSQGRFWVSATKDGLNLFDPESGRALRFRAEPGAKNGLADQVYSLREDKDGRFWIPTWSGLSVLDMRDTSFTNFYHEPGNTSSLSSSLVYSVTIDSRNQIWLPTGLGLDLYDPAIDRFTHFFYDPLNPHSLIHDFVYSVYEARDGIFWITTANGISKWRPHGFSFIPFVNTLEEKKKSNFEGGYRDLLEDSRGNIWVPTRSNGLFLYNPQTGIYRHFNPLPSWRSVDVGEDRNDRIWVSGDLGLFYYDPISADLKSLCKESPALCQQAPLLATPLSFSFDQEGYLWGAGGPSDLFN